MIHTFHAVHTLPQVQVQVIQTVQEIDKGAAKACNEVSVTGAHHILRKGGRAYMSAWGIVRPASTPSAAHNESAATPRHTTFLKQALQRACLVSIL